MFKEIFKMKKIRSSIFIAYIFFNLAHFKIVDGLIVVSGVTLAVYVVGRVEVGCVGLRLVRSLLNIFSSSKVFSII